MESTPPPPSTFRAIILRIFFFLPRTALSRLFSFESCASFDAIFVQIGGTVPKLCNRASAQNMGILWLCVQNIWKMAFCAKNPCWALKVLILVNITVICIDYQYLNNSK